MIVISACNEIKRQQSISESSGGVNYEKGVICPGDTYKVYTQIVHLLAQGVVPLISDVPMSVTGSQWMANLQLLRYIKDWYTYQYTQQR